MKQQEIVTQKSFREHIVFIFIVQNEKQSSENIHIMLINMKVKFD